MMRLLPILTALVLVAASSLAADAPPPLARGFAAGAFTDDYFGVRYAQAGLEAVEPERQSAERLFRGRTGEGAQVEVSVIEYGPQASTVDWLAKAKETWARSYPDRTDVDEGKTPRPWTIFAAPNAKGGMRQEGFAFYPNGNFVFAVHAWVPEKSSTSRIAVRSALDALEVKGAPDAYLLVHEMTLGGDEDPRAPRTIAKAASIYLRKGPRQKVEIAALAAQSAIRLGEDDLDGSELWQVHYLLGLAQLETGRNDDAVETWKRCVKLAKRTNDPNRSGAVSHYNLAASYARLGKDRKAFGELEDAFEMEREAGRSKLRDGAPKDPDFAKMRSDPRWQQVVGATR